MFLHNHLSDAKLRLLGEGRRKPTSVIPAMPGIQIIETLDDIRLDILGSWSHARLRPIANRHE